MLAQLSCFAQVTLDPTAPGQIARLRLSLVTSSVRDGDASLPGRSGLVRNARCPTLSGPSPGASRATTLSSEHDEAAGLTTKKHRVGCSHLGRRPADLTPKRPATWCRAPLRSSTCVFVGWRTPCSVLDQPTAAGVERQVAHSGISAKSGLQASIAKAVAPSPWVLRSLRETRCACSRAILLAGSG